MSVSLKIDSEVVANLLAVVPKQVLLATQRYTFGIFVEHRMAWLRLKGNKFGRGTGKSIRVKRVGEGMDSVGPKDVVYSLPPKDKPVTDGEARALLADYSAAIYTGNVILPIHQFGEDIRSGRYMAIAVNGNKIGSPAAYRAKYPGRKVVAFRSKRHPGEFVLRRKVRARKGIPAAYETLYRLTKFVDMKPTLKFYETWEQQESEREQRWKDAVDSIYANLVRPTVAKATK